MDVNSVNADVNAVNSDQCTPYKNGAIPDYISGDSEQTMDPEREHIREDDLHVKLTDISSDGIRETKTEVLKVTQVFTEEEPQPVQEEPIEVVKSTRERAPPPPARSRSSSSSSSSSSSNKEHQKITEEKQSDLKEAAEEPIVSVDRKDIEKEGEFISSSFVTEVGRTLETSESSAVSTSKEVVESGDRTEIKVTERKVTSLEEVEEFVREYPLEEAGNTFQGVPGGEEEVVLTKEIRVVEEFQTVHTQKEVTSGGVVKIEKTVEEHFTKQETEVGDSQLDKQSGPPETEDTKEEPKEEESQQQEPDKEESKQSPSSDQEAEEAEEDKSSPSKSKKERFLDFFKRKPQKDKEANEEQEVKEEQKDSKEEGEQQKEEEGEKSEAKQTPEKKKKHFLIFKKPELKEKSQKDKEDEEPDKVDVDNKQENKEDEEKSEEGELDNKDKGEKKKKYHFFHFKKSDTKEQQQDKGDHPEAADEGEKPAEQTEGNIDSKSLDEEKDNRNSSEKKKYHFFPFRRSEQKDNEGKTKADESTEEKEQEAKEEDTEETKSEDTENKNTLDRKKKHHFFHFHKTDRKEPQAEEENQKEEEHPTEEGKSPNKNTLERKKRGFFHFKKSETKEPGQEQEEEEKPEESGVKQTPEKKKLALFKVFPSNKEKKDKKDRVTVEQKEDEEEDTSKESLKEVDQVNGEFVHSTETMDGSSPEETERLEIFKTTERPRSFILNEDRPVPVTASPTNTAPSPTQKSSVTRPSPQPSTSQLVTPLHSPLDLSGNLDAAVARPASETSEGRITPGAAHGPGHFVVVAIDFGTTFSGYAFSFTRDPDSIHMMRKWEGGDPGVINQKTPTCLLLHPDGKFHSFGFTARDFFHDLDPQESKKWLYFDKFKMTLHYNAELNKDTMIKASNGKLMQALSIFTHALRFFKEHALQELSDQSSTKILNEDVRWVITVPAIWKAAAKQFMRQAAYNAGIAAPEYPDQLLIALEPEAASIYVRRLRMHQLVPERHAYKTLSPRKEGTPEPMNMDKVCDEMRNGTRYIVVDCGGGTVDITVHEMESKYGNLHELYKATGGPYGSVGVDIEFEKLLVDIFGADFMEAFKYKRPAGFVDLMIAFESRKRAATPYKNNPLNVSLPFSFIDYHKKFRNSQVESAIRKYGDKEIRWSSQGMLRLSPEAMRRLFQPTLDRIKQSIGDVLNNPAVRDIRYMFLVGGFSESQILQHELRREFGHLLRIIIPQDVSLTILKGAVCFGMDPTVVKLRKSRMTYGVGVLNRFVPGKHPPQKLVRKDGVDWCTDVFDKFVVTDQSVALGDTTLRSYTPAKAGQKTSIINIYCSERSDCEFITDRGVERVGSLCLDLSHVQYGQTLPRRREIQTRMIFGDTEIKVTALDVATGKCVRAAIDFLSK